jgi:hypothetical protein
MESPPALQAQTRISWVVARVSKSAVWTLVAANLLFAVYTLVLTGMAYAAASTDAHWVHTRQWRRSDLNSHMHTRKSAERMSCLRSTRWKDLERSRRRRLSEGQWRCIFRDSQKYLMGYVHAITFLHKARTYRINLFCPRSICA